MGLTRPNQGGFMPRGRRRSGGPMNGMYPAQVANTTGQNQPSGNAIPGSGLAPTYYGDTSGGGPQPAADDPASRVSPFGTGSWSMGGQSGVAPVQGPMLNNTREIAGAGRFGGRIPGLDPNSVAGPTSQSEGGNWWNGYTRSYDTTPSDIRGLRGVLSAQLGMNLGDLYGRQVSDPNRVQLGNPMMLRQGFSGNPMMIDPNSYLPNAARGDVRDVNSPTTQSVDQLGGANSPFYQNVVNQLQPSFDIQRQRALAQTKEQLGNLTGSSYVNKLGDTMNRSLADERAQLLGYATGAMNTEVGRQTAMANLGNQAGIANQGADLSFINQMLNRGQLGLNAGIANQNSRQAYDLARNDYNLRQGMANQGTRQTYDTTQANLDQQRNLEMYGRQMGMSDADASRYAQLLLGMATTGVQGRQITQSGGFSSMIPGLATAGAAYFGSRYGGWGGGSGSSGSSPNTGG